MVAKTTEIERLFLSGYGMIGKNNDLDVTGFDKYRLIQAAYHGNVEEVNKMLRKKGKCFCGREERKSKLQNTKLNIPRNFLYFYIRRCKMQISAPVHDSPSPYMGMHSINFP